MRFFHYRFLYDRYREAYFVKSEVILLPHDAPLNELCWKIEGERFYKDQRASGYCPDWLLRKRALVKVEE